MWELIKLFSAVSEIHTKEPPKEAQIESASVQTSLFCEM